MVEDEDLYDTYNNDPILPIHKHNATEYMCY